jgi:endonuclease YncB( thermonuclease family)
MTISRSAALFLILFASLSLAHSGGVDANGCHVDKATNQRHCHPAPVRARKLTTCDLRPAPKEGDEGVFYGPVVHVADGDTLDVKVQGVVMDFRLAEVDAPEHDQPYGKESRAELASLVAGKRVVLAPLDTDRYGRTVAFVWAGESCVNEQLVDRGAAWFYSQYSTSDYLFGFEEDARDNKRGLWALPARDRIEPWVWRRSKRHPSS